MTLYRIKQISETEFIPQGCWNFWDFISNQWFGIDIHLVKVNYGVWYSDKHQLLYCKCNTLMEAKEVIADFIKIKESILLQKKQEKEIKKKYPIYYEY